MKSNPIIFLPVKKNDAMLFLHLVFVTKTLVWKYNQKDRRKKKKKNREVLSLLSSIPFGCSISLARVICSFFGAKLCLSYANCLFTSSLFKTHVYSPFFEKIKSKRAKIAVTVFMIILTTSGVMTWFKHDKLLERTTPSSRNLCRKHKNMDEK